MDRLLFIPLWTIFFLVSFIVGLSNYNFLVSSILDMIMQLFSSCFVYIKLLWYISVTWGNVFSPSSQLRCETGILYLPMSYFSRRLLAFLVKLRICFIDRVRFKDRCCSLGPITHVLLPVKYKTTIYLEEWISREINALEGKVLLLPKEHTFGSSLKALLVKWPVLCYGLKVRSMLAISLIKKINRIIRIQSLTIN